MEFRTKKKGRVHQWRKSEQGTLKEECTVELRTRNSQGRVRCGVQNRDESSREESNERKPPSPKGGEIKPGRMKSEEIKTLEDEE